MLVWFLNELGVIFSERNYMGELHSFSMSNRIDIFSKF